MPINNDCTYIYNVYYILVNLTNEINQFIYINFIKFIYINFIKIKNSHKINFFLKNFFNFKNFLKIL